MKLAIDGGAALREKPFSPWPLYDDGEKKALLEALNSGQWWRMSGTQVVNFEAEFADYHSSKTALAVCNGTQALEVALLAHGIGPGDEVIVPAFTFISTSMAVQRVGAVAIPVDIDINNYCIDLQAVEAAITEKTKAVIPVHMAGHGVDMEGLERISSLHNIFIIQDAAHAHGAIFQNKKIGAWSSVSCFSFQNYKLMTAGEGGLILFPNEELYERAFLFHNCGRPAKDLKYMHKVIGSNYRLNEFSAAVLREQLKRLGEQNGLRDKNATILDEALENIEGVIPQSRADYVELHPHYMAMFRLDRATYPEVARDWVVDALVAEGIPAFRNYKSIYKTEAFRQEPAPSGTTEFWCARCPNTEIISNDGIWIHHRVLLGEREDVLDVVRAIEKVLEGYKNETRSKKE